MAKPSRVLVIGSGPIIIGQAAEFDYAGTQACKSLREEGIVTVLVNSNPATIMTDQGIADIVYIEPLTVEVISRIIERERPDGLLPTLGGQTGLNTAVFLARAGVFKKYNVEVLGASAEAIARAEDRELLRDPEAVVIEAVARSDVHEAGSLLVGNKLGGRKDPVILPHLFLLRHLRLDPVYVINIRELAAVELP